MSVARHLSKHVSTLSTLDRTGICVMFRNLHSLNCFECKTYS